MSVSQLDPLLIVHWCVKAEFIVMCMRMVLAGMNEMTWQRVAEWEVLHEKECGAPKLRRFVGRPDALSPLARLKALFGRPIPFDRHDWCGRPLPCQIT